MGNSLLLRGDAGRMDGYVQQCAGTLRCRVSRGAARGSRLVVRFADGSIREYPLAQEGAEQQFSAPAVGLGGACVVTDSAVLCATDEASRAMGWTALRRTDEAENRRESLPSAPEDGMALTEEKPQEKGRMENPPPEPRWPPPPCIAQARYDGGRWVSRGEAAAPDGAAPARGAP